MSKWISIDSAYGDWVLSKPFDSKKDALDHAVRNCCSGYKSKRIYKSVYEIQFENASSACVCKEEELESLGYVINFPFEIEIIVDKP